MLETKTLYENLCLQMRLEPADGLFIVFLNELHQLLNKHEFIPLKKYDLSMKVFRCSIVS